MSWKLVFILIDSDIAEIFDISPAVGGYDVVRVVPQACVHKTEVGLRTNSEQTDLPTSQGLVSGLTEHVNMRYCGICLCIDCRAKRLRIRLPSASSGARPLACGGEIMMLLL